MRRSANYVLVALLALLILSGFRLYLFSMRSEDLAGLAASGVATLFFNGFRLDGVVVAGLMAPLALVLLLTPGRLLRGALCAARIWAGLVFLFLLLCEISGVFFFRYYDFRPNYLVVEHGSDPEVLGAVVAGYPLVLICVSALVGSLLLLALLIRALRLPDKQTGRAAILDHGAMLVLLALTALAARGTLDHRPLNPSAATFSSNRLANEIAGSGIFNVVYEIAQRSRGRYVAVAEVVKTIDPQRAVEVARRFVSRHGTALQDSDNPLLRVVHQQPRERPINVVLVVLESYTARLVGHLGGEPAVTPELDRLADEALVLGNCLATGERTIQGLEATVCSFPPLPGVGVVRRPEAWGNFSTLATLLKQRDYETFFAYGGQGIFDHMRGFFLKNGYDRFIEEKDFDDVTFRGAWGVCDEDLYRRTLRECGELHSRGKPFFATLLTVSLHSPWEYPEDRIKELPRHVSRPKGFDYEELNTFLYADYAIGRFIRDARKTGWFDDTLFVFVGDHGVHLRGKKLVPVDEYRVAALFLAPRHVKTQRIDRVTSQLDVAPTIMGILGGDYRTTFFGEDVLADVDGDGFALMVHNKKRFGVIRGNRLSFLTHEGQAGSFEREQIGSRWTRTEPTAPHANDSETAISILQVAEELLTSENYHTGKQVP